MRCEFTRSSPGVPTPILTRWTSDFQPFSSASSSSTSPVLVIAFLPLRHLSPSPRLLLASRASSSSSRLAPPLPPLTPSSSSLSPSSSSEALAVSSFSHLVLVLSPRPRSLTPSSPSHLWSAPLHSWCTISIEGCPGARSRLKDTQVHDLF
ncbi:hypothetical protein BD626DRAFT_177932 [Schizophyllum amplum]|uniref:Uncharacterized protein n=1 Tax=Schizophyllum amplum TaxID=97359 RepID=A0A550C2L1_9AGAR|nr:hypothetical protein BD626DRAFT_177932 [Auriculariopsis ampla]